jgi:MFS family permease
MSMAGGAFGAVRHRDFRPYFVTTLLSMMADNVEQAQGESAYTVLRRARPARCSAGFALEASAFFRQPRERTAVLMALGWAAAIAVFALVPSYPVAIAALFAAGLLNLGFVTMAQTLVQLEAPPAERGRVVGLFSLSNNGLRVGSGITVGILGAVIGIHWSLALSAIAFLVVGVALLGYASDRARRAAVVATPAD